MSLPSTQGPSSLGMFAYLTNSLQLLTIARIMVRRTLADWLAAVCIVRQRCTGDVAMAYVCSTYIIIADRPDVSKALALQAEAALLSAAVVYWATSTMLERPSAALAAAPADPAALIGKLQLVAPAGGGAPRLQVTAPALTLPPETLLRLPRCFNVPGRASVHVLPTWRVLRVHLAFGRANLPEKGGGGGTYATGTGHPGAPSIRRRNPAERGALCNGNWSSLPLLLIAP